MTFAALRALHATIGHSIDDLERIYRECSNSKPLDYPRLEDPYYAHVSHSADEELAQQLTHENPAVSLASKRIVASCGQLTATVNRPWYGLIESIKAGDVSAALRFMEAAHIPEILRELGPKGVHVQDIHRAVVELRREDARPDPSIFTPMRLGHLLRVLATSHWVQEVAPDVYANNRRSSYIDSGKTLEQLRTEPGKKYLGTNGVAAFTAFAGGDACKSANNITEWLLPDIRIPSPVSDAEGQCSRAGGGEPMPEGPSDVENLGTHSAVVQYHAPFNIAFDERLDFFSWLERPENRSRLERFGHAVTGTCLWETTDEILHGYPWAELPSGSVLVDVAGGIGSTSIKVAQAYPHVQVVVEDRPQVVELAPSSWGPQYAPLFNSGRMTFRAQDIFAPRERLASGKEPDVFLLRTILHDWQDEDCRCILRQLRSAAGPSTKLLIGDMLLPHACTPAVGGEALLVADHAPLLPNLGMGNIHGYIMDITMMAAFGAKERTVEEMSQLALSTGWKVETVKRFPGSLWAYTTAVPV
ncbi:S-adenosyl-L-methionine-dependent methyltransferase [Trametes cingulata]|nr:S-adenosyl-L-methionine-dependent methyltransferase [Trametes cingulata]